MSEEAMAARYVSERSHILAGWPLATTASLLLTFSVAHMSLDICPEYCLAVSS